MSPSDKIAATWICLEWPNDVTHTGGVGRYAFRMATAMADRVDLTVVTYAGARRIHGVEFIELPRPRNRFDRFYVTPLRLRRITRRIPADLVHGHGDDWALTSTPPKVRSFYGSALSEARSSTGLRKINHYLLHWLEMVSAKRSTTSVAIAPESQDLFGCAAVMPPLTSVATRSPRAKTSTPSVVFIGLYEGRKRGYLAETVVAQVAQVLGSTVDFTAIAPSEDRARWATSTTVVSDASDETVADIVGSAWILLAPSLYEGFGIPTVEALTLGVTVVATPNPGNSYLQKLATPGLPLHVVPDSKLVETIVSIIHAGPDLATREICAVESFAQTLRSLIDPDRLMNIYEKVN